MFPQYGGLSLANWRAKKTNSCFVTARLCEVIQYNAPLRALRVQGHCLLGEGVPARHLVVGLGVVERALSVAEPALAGVLEGGHLHALVGARSRLLVREGLGQELLGREELLRGGLLLRGLLLRGLLLRGLLGLLGLLLLRLLGLPGLLLLRQLGLLGLLLLRLLGLLLRLLGLLGLRLLGLLLRLLLRLLGLLLRLLLRLLGLLLRLRASSRGRRALRLLLLLLLLLRAQLARQLREHVGGRLLAQLRGRSLGAPALLARGQLADHTRLGRRHVLAARAHLRKHLRSAHARLARQSAQTRAAEPGTARATSCQTLADRATARDAPATSNLRTDPTHQRRSTYTAPTRHSTPKRRNDLPQPRRTRTPPGTRAYTRSTAAALQGCPTRPDPPERPPADARETTLSDAFKHDTSTDIDLIIRYFTCLPYTRTNYFIFLLRGTPPHPHQQYLIYLFIQDF